METTRIFNRLPSDAGVVFEGFERITIQSRLYVKKKLEEFIEIIKSERKPTMRVIVGEWGEGKTDAFKRYIEPITKEIGYGAFFVSASTLSNSFELPDVKRLMNATPSSSLQFLVALFASIKAESQISAVTDPANFFDPNEFVEDSLVRLTTNREKLIVFIDEFEELLLNLPILKKIISGIKETINGQFRPIYEGGKFEGCLHFIIAATPDAFYKLQVSEETSLIFGGLGRRVGVIELPEIRKHEGIPFLWELLKYCFDYNLPKPLPIKSIGILNGIYRITHGNPGNMVSKFTRLMNRAAREIDDPDKMKVVDYKLFLDFFKNETIFVYGGSTPCIEVENYDRILNIVKDLKRAELGKACANVLSLLVGEYKPFASYEIEERIKVTNAPNIVSIINNNLQRLGIQKAILSVAKAKEGITLDDIKNKLSEFIVKEKDRDIIRIDNYIEVFDNFVDRITFYDLLSNELCSEIYLPIDDRSIISFFEGIGEDRVVEIRNKFRKLCSNEKYYIASDELLLQVFPTPVPKELEFIKDRELKMKLWRETTKSLTEQYDKYVPNALLTILEASKNFKIDRIREERGLTFVRIYVDDVEINTLFFAVDGDLKGEDIDEIHKYIKGWKPPIHLVLAIYTGDITEKGEEKIEEKELGKNGENIIIPIKLHPTLTKKIIIMHKMYLEHTDKIDDAIFHIESRKVVQQDIELDRKLREWLRDQESLGLVVSDPKLDSAKSAKELADTLKFYINFVGENLTVQEAFDRNRTELQKFIKYGSKIGFIPDIESAKTLEKLSRDLENNGFLKRESNGTYRVIEHPVEKRILKLIGSAKGKLDVKSLEEYFIITSSNRRILEHLFLNILEHKGRIIKEKNIIELTSESELKYKLDFSYENLRRVLDDKDEKYGFCFVRKQRDEKVISLNDFLDFVSKQYEELDRIIDVDVRLQRMFLLCRLIEYFSREWLNAIKKAKNEAEEKVKDINEKLEKFKMEAENVCNDFNRWLKIIIDLDDIKEYNKIVELSNKVKEIESYSSYEELENIFREYYDDFNGDELFDYRKQTDEYPYFNVKLFIIDSLVKKFDEIIESALSGLKKISKKFDGINTNIQKISLTIKSKEFNKEYVLSSILHEYLRTCLGDLMPSLKETKIANKSIAELENIVDQYLEPIEENINAMQELIEYTDNLHKEEKLLFEKKLKTKNFIDKANEIFDLEDYKPKLEEVEKNFNTLLGKLNSLPAEISSHLEEDPKEFLNYVTKEPDLIDHLKDISSGFSQIKNDLEDIWNEYKRSTLEYLKHLTRTINVVKKKHKELSSIFATLLSYINSLKLKIDGEFIALTIKLSEMEKEKIKIRDKFYELIKNILNRDEILVLETVVELSRRSRMIWVEQIYGIIKSKLNIDSNKINEILSKLVREGYLKLGVSLAV